MKQMSTQSKSCLWFFSAVFQPSLSFVLFWNTPARAHTHTHTHTHTHPCLLGTSSGLFTRHLQNQIYIFPHLFLLHVTPLPQLLPLLFVIIITPEIYYCFYPQILQKSLDWVGNLPRVMQSQGQAQDLKIYWVCPALILLTTISLLQ